MGRAAEGDWELETPTHRFAIHRNLVVEPQQHGDVGGGEVAEAVEILHVGDDLLPVLV